MPKIKKARVPVRIDMTPLVDVSFLLLTFFMLTTQFTPPEQVKIEVPTSHAAIKLPESNILTIYVDVDGQIFMGVDSQNLMVSLFGQEARLKKEVQVNLENLGNLLIQARVGNPRLRTVVKADKEANYGVISDLMDLLQKTQITRFSIITDLEES